MIKELKEYKEIFESEAKEILEKCEKIVLKIEKEGFKKEFLDELFRHFHTLKGSSASIGEFEIEKISHELEDKLDEIRKGKKEYLDVEELFKKIDEIKKLIEKKEEGEIYEIEIYLSSETPLKNVRAFVIIKEISKKAKIIETYPDIESIKQDKFDFSFKLKIKGNKEEVEEILNLFSDIEYYKILPLKKEEKEIIEKKEEIFEIKVKSENIDRIINYMGELVIEKDKLKNIIYEKKDKEIIESFDHFERILNSLSDLTINLRLVPAKIIFGTIPRYVRDEAKKLNKEVEIEIIGEEIEIDRIILEKLKEPILHIIRNSIDHGIEEPEERIRIGKKRSGKIILEIKKDKGIVFIKIKDDGRGIEKEKIIKRAIELNIIREEEIDKIDEEKILQILTNPLFTTKKDVTRVSGRGVGLYAVKETVTKIGGEIKINFEKGKGTEIILRIPVSLAIIKSVIVESGNEKYVIPLNYISSIRSIKHIKIFSIQNKKFTIINKKLYPIYNFNKLIGIKNDEKDLREGILIEGENMNFVLLVNKIVSEQDVFVKNIDEIFMKIPYVTGGTILGDGKPYLIIDPISLVKKGAE